MQEPTVPLSGKQEVAVPVPTLPVQGPSPEVAMARTDEVAVPSPNTSRAKEPRTPEPVSPLSAPAKQEVAVPVPSLPVQEPASAIATAKKEELAMPSGTISTAVASPTKEPVLSVASLQKDEPVVPSRNFLSRRARKQPSLVNVFKKHGLRDEDAAAMLNGFLKPNEKMMRAISKELNMSFEVMMREWQRQHGPARAKGTQKAPSSQKSAFLGCEPSRNDSRTARQKF